MDGTRLRSLTGEVEFEFDFCVSGMRTKDGELSFKRWTLALEMDNRIVYNM